MLLNEKESKLRGEQEKLEYMLRNNLTGRAYFYESYGIYPVVSIPYDFEINEEECYILEDHFQVELANRRITQKQVEVEFYLLHGGNSKGEVDLTFDLREFKDEEQIKVCLDEINRLLIIETNKRK
jgi:hypothetical protein